jgi:6-phosphogluconolactonase
MNMNNSFQDTICLACIGLLLTTLAACGGGGYSAVDNGGGGGTATYSIGGTVSGLTGSGLVLQDNGGDDFAVTGTGAFTFATSLDGSATYSVTIKTQPSSPAESCAVSNGSGTLAAANVTNVSVTCAAAFTVGGSVTEMTGSGLVVQINGGDDLTINTSGQFAFATPVAIGSSYAVTVKTQPTNPAQVCSVGQYGWPPGTGTGTMGSTNVENIRIACGPHFAYTANAGDNTVSAYTIAPFSGALAAVGGAVTTGMSPSAIAGTPDRRHLYVANKSSNNISAYAIDATTGALTPIPSSPIAAGTTPQAMAFDLSGAYLYVANFGSSNLSAYAVDSTSGALTPLATSTYSTGSGPSAIALDPTGKFIYVTNNGGSNDISVFQLTAATGALTPAPGSPFAAGGNPHSVSVSGILGPGDTYVYTANSSGTASSISAFSVATNTGALSAVTGSPFALSVSNHIGMYSGYGDTLIVTTSTGVVAYFVGGDGSLTTFPDYVAATGANPYSVAFFRPSSTLYVANEGSATIAAFFVDDVGATLTELPGSPFPAGAHPKFIAIL